MSYSTKNEVLAYTYAGSTFTLQHSQVNCILVCHNVSSDISLMNTVQAFKLNWTPTLPAGVFFFKQGCRAEQVESVADLVLLH